MALLEIKSRKNLIEIRKEISTVVNNKNMEKLAYLVEQGLAEQRETIKIFSEKITAFDEVIRSLEVEKQFVKDPIVRFIQIPFTIKMLKGKPTGVEGMKEILKIMKDEEERTMKFLALFKIDKTKNSN
ncbi:MAG: hypothetical protein Q7S21_01180 [archaeon]|nr:hypothetical protein [archaeon]